ncbi:(deoxy)nucleoside triphosphate pyrophosphohydrolase [Mangrovibacterium lignilyticum]|uniref:(deoxy)nucleoside triphosphate pyrophosphohydrolase n=1 Tax=Mangrovibacterium lignilyticum TaxID=2668052 RepID=UPI0013D4DB4F|nr:(deoxy)nucleoside triphosphate pyrophosphohydrolase [Mangrovibacterium lignilyticum]
MIDVCCALIVCNNRLLAVQRGADSDHPGEWEFPGGKIEPGESAVACIKREIVEELAVSVVVEAYLFPVCHDYGIKQIRLHPFVCSIQNGVIVLDEHTNFCWLDADDLEKPDWQVADRKLLQLNQIAVSQRLRENNEDR